MSQFSCSNSHQWPSFDIFVQWGPVQGVSIEIASNIQIKQDVKAGSLDMMFSWLYTPWSTPIQNSCWGVKFDNLICLCKGTMDTSPMQIFPSTWLLFCLTWFFIKYKITSLDLPLTEALMTMNDPCWTSNSLFWMAILVPMPPCSLFQGPTMGGNIIYETFSC